MKTLVKLYKFSLFALFLLFLSHQTFSKSFYVSSSYTGTTSNGGLLTPWKTLSSVQSGLSGMAAGDSVFFKKGDRFSGSIIIQGKTGIYFGTYGVGDAPLFWGNGSTISCMFMIRSSSNLIFNGFSISDTTISATDRTTQAKIQIAFTIEQSSRNNQFLNCKMDRIGYGFYITSTSPGQKIDGCDIGNLRMIRNTPTTVNPDDDYGGVPVQMSSSNNIFTNNYLHDCWSQSYDYGYDGGGVEFFEEGAVIENNQIAYNTFYDCNGTFEHGSNSDGIANNPIRNNQIYYNKFINCSSLFYINNNGQYKTSVSNLQFYNNILVQNVASRTGNRIICSMATSETTQGIVVFKNNIFRVSNGASMMRSGQWTGGQFIHENNIYQISGGGVLNFTLSTTELSNTQNYWQNTTSSNPIDWDYRLLANTQPINFGQSVGLNRDFAGSSMNGLPDLGIYEFASSVVTTTPLTANATVSPMLCYAGTTNVTISATGGTPPYSGIGTFINGAGMYTYIVSDATGTRDTVQVLVTQPTAITPVVNAGTITVAGGSTTVTVTASGGTGSVYQYNMNGSVYQNSGNFSNVLAGTHTFTAKDQNGCIGARNITIAEPAVATLVASASAGSIMCNGGTTTVAVTATGGVQPYIGTGSFTMSAGSRTFIVTDSRGTTASISVTVTQPTAVSLTASAGTITQNGGTTSITATTTGGTGTAYQYNLNGSAYQTSGTFNNVSAGTYTINARDVNGCMATRSLTITEPAVATLVASASAGSIMCNGGTTTVVVTASGGVQPYSGTGNFTMSAGSRTFTVTDSRGTTASISVTVTQPTAVALTASAGTINQNGGTTSITATATGGTGTAYQYNLNGSAYQTSGTFINVSAGTYTINARDVNGCMATRSLTITEPAVATLVASASAGSIMCNGGTTTVVVTATGGVQPYTGTGSFTIGAGSYQYIVTDSRGNRDTVSVIAGQPAILNLSLSAVSITTPGGTTNITANASGGTMPFQYAINGGTYQTSNQFSGFSAGSYTVTVKDANGCLKSSNTSIATPIFDSLKVVATAGTITCFGGTAAVTIVAIGGNAPYTGTGTYFMSAGTRTFTVVDATGAISNVNVTLTQPTEIIALVNVAGDVLTVGGTTSVTVSVSGGVGPYLYSLDGGVSQNSNTFRSVNAGSHTIAVVDQNGCIKIVSFTVNTIESTNVPLKLVVVSKSDVTCRGARDGKVEVFASGGRPPYQYAIGNGSYGFSNIFSNLKAGYYRIRVRDANQTIVSVVVQILDGRRSCGRSMGDNGTDADLNSTNSVQIETVVYPNPSNSDFNLKINASSNEDASVEVVDMYGKRVVQSKMKTNNSMRLGQQLKPGIYFIRVIVKDKVYVTKVVKL